MIKLCADFLGIDLSFLSKKDFGVVYKVALIIVSILILSLVSMIYGLDMALDSLLLAILVSLFVVLIIYNFYRLIFSIIEGELEFNTNYLDISKFIFKRGFVLILISIFVSKSFQTLIFSKQVSNYLDEYKRELLIDYNKQLDKSYGKEIESIIISYESKIDFEESIGIDNSVYLSKEKDSLINLIQIEIDKEKIEINNAISNSNFFITRISLLSSKMPFSWIVTLLLATSFMSPIFIFITNSSFKNYDKFSREISNKIILEHYDYFKKKYSELMKKSADLDIVYEEKYQDPPYNSIKIHSSEKYLTKGSLIKWINKYGE